MPHRKDSALASRLSAHWTSEAMENTQARSQCWEDYFANELVTIASCHVQNGIVV